MNKKVKLGFIITLIIGLIGVAVAFWASSVFVNSSEDTINIQVGTANPVDTTLSITGDNKDNLVPIGAINNSPIGSVEYVLIPLTLHWTEDTSNYATGLTALFTVTPSVIIDHHVANPDDNLYNAAKALVNVYFLTDPSVTENTIKTTLDLVVGSNANTFANELKVLDNNVTKDAFAVELTIEVPKTIWLVAFIAMPSVNTYLYIAESIINVNLTIAANLGQNDPIPIVPTENVKFKTADGGKGFSVAIDDKGALWSWGYRNYGQLGDGQSSGNVPIPTPLPVTSSMNGVVYTSISAGSYHTLALDDQGRMWGWGYNQLGQIGNGNRTNVTTPTIIAASMRFKVVSAGDNFSVAIDTDGKIWSWGYTWLGRLGYETTGEYVTTPQQVPTLNDQRFIEVGAGFAHVVAIDINHNLWSWGYNNNGQVGNNSTTDVLAPIQLANPLNTKFMKLSVPTTTISMALDSEGQIWGWGANSLYDLGDGTTTNRLYPVLITDKAVNVFVDLATGIYTGNAIDQQGRLWGWGTSDNGSIGLLGVAKIPTLINPSASSFFVTIGMGAEHTIAIDRNGHMWVTGINAQYQLGLGSGNTNNSNEYIMHDIKRRLT